MSWTSLQAEYPWPDTRPPCGPHVHGWCVHTEQWKALLSGIDRPIMLELGAWTGKTSAWLCEQFPELRLIAADVWTVTRPAAMLYLQNHWARWVAGGMVPADQTPCDLYRSNLWGHRDRVVAVREASVAAMQAVAAHIQPSVVYIDADHAYEAARPDIECAVQLFPESVICGDDYMERPRIAESGIRDAVHDVADCVGRTVRVDGRFWRYE